MILFLFLLLVLLIFVAIVTIIVGAVGTGALIIFAEPIICIILIALILKGLFSNKTPKNK